MILYQIPVTEDDARAINELGQHIKTFNATQNGSSLAVLEQPLKYNKKSYADFSTACCKSYEQRGGCPVFPFMNFIGRSATLNFMNVSSKSIVLNFGRTDISSWGMTGDKNSALDNLHIEISGSPTEILGRDSRELGIGPFGIGMPFQGGIRGFPISRLKLGAVDLRTTMNVDGTISNRPVHLLYARKGG